MFSTEISGSINLDQIRALQGFPGGANGSEEPVCECRRTEDLGLEDPLEEGKATQSTILAWRNPWTAECGRLWCTGSQRVGHD